jgi:hypothetical protein
MSFRRSGLHNILRAYQFDTKVISTPSGNIEPVNPPGPSFYLPYQNISYSADGSFNLSHDTNYNTICSFIGNGTFTLNSDASINYIIVGGGGGGAAYNISQYSTGGAGGGGGQIIYGNVFLNSGTYQINVGNGGSGSTCDPNILTANGKPGVHSSIVGNTINIFAKGGNGGNGAINYSPPITCNGGNSGSGTSGGKGGVANTPQFSPKGQNAPPGGGGGGAGTYYSGSGGNGSETVINDILLYPVDIMAFGAGGGGGAYNSSGGTGGNSNAGNGLSNMNAVANTGCGGGGGGLSSGNGGSGIIILFFNKY